MTACSSSSLPMALDIFRRVPTDCDIWDSWASWWFTRCSCCRIWFWRSSWVELTEFVFVESREGEPVVASRLYLVFWLRMTLGTKLLLLWPEAEVGLDKDVMSMGVWKFVNNGTLLRKVNRSSSFCKGPRTSKVWKSKDPKGPRTFRLYKSADLCKNYYSH